MEYIRSQLNTVNKSVDSSAANDASGALRKFATEKGIKPNKNNKYDVLDIQNAIANEVAYSSMSDIQKNANPILKAIDALIAQGIKEF
jgi:hypothetical protein